MGTVEQGNGNGQVEDDHDPKQGGETEDSLSPQRRLEAAELAGPSAVTGYNGVDPHEAFIDMQHAGIDHMGG